MSIRYSYKSEADISLVPAIGAIRITLAGLEIPSAKTASRCRTERSREDAGATHWVPLLCGTAGNRRDTLLRWDDN